MNPTVCATQVCGTRFQYLVLLQERGKEGRYTVPWKGTPRRTYHVAEHSALTGMRLFPGTEGLGECAAWIDTHTWISEVELRKRTRVDDFTRCVSEFCTHLGTTTHI